MIARRPLVIAALALTVFAGACGSSGGTAATTVAPDTVVQTLPDPDAGGSTDSVADTVPGPTPSFTTVTTVAAPTTTEVLPVPKPAPAPHAKEPIVQLGTIEIPKIGVSAPMFEGVSLTVLDHGPGHWPGSAMPGHLGNAVIAGHRTSHSRPFRNIDKLVPGDEVIFTTAEGRFVYKVTGTEVVLPTALRILDQTDHRTATLFACHPPGSTRQRFVVHLALAP